MAVAGQTVGCCCKQASASSACTAASSQGHLQPGFGLHTPHATHAAFVMSFLPWDPAAFRMLQKSAWAEAYDAADDTPLHLAAK